LFLIFFQFLKFETPLRLVNEATLKYIIVYATSVIFIEPPTIVSIYYQSSSRMIHTDAQNFMTI
jgi:hypothetical protein